MRTVLQICLLLAVGGPLFAAAPGPLFVEPRLAHLRSGGVREWADFPKQAEGAEVEFKFAGQRNGGECSLRLRQQNVKQGWRVLINGKPLGVLTRDENEMVVYWPIPAGTLVDGENRLRIEPTSRKPEQSDDIRVGDARIEPRAVAEVLREATVEVQVTDEASGDPLPCRITIAGERGALQTVAVAPDEKLAVRPGVIYTADGRARFTLPAGRYTLYAGRGFEYSLAQAEVTLAVGETKRQELSLRREVSTPGYVACDTHIHTLTHSGHGDCTLDERMITLAGEGIELPIATDHNIQIDYTKPALKLDVHRYFTPVVGNEVTTGVGHFNVFPIAPGARLPNHKLTDWAAIFDDLERTPGVQAVILNHARDLHSGVRPFGPKLFNGAAGENVQGWPLRFNAMEVINSGATQTDPRQLLGDWLALLNAGHSVTPVGSSDSHDVARFIVGQGRTYIRCDDAEVGRLNVREAVQSFVQGRVMVSYGLLAEITVDEKYREGDLAKLAGDEVRIALRVLGPHWTVATRVELYANGSLVRSEEIDTEALRDLPRGVKWQATWQIPRPKHDVHLVAVAWGPGITSPHWPTARPYQPTSPDWAPSTFACSGAVWLDGDDDGKRSPARRYAEQIFAASEGNLARLIAGLADRDVATAIQSASLYRAAGGSLTSDEFAAALKSAPPAVRSGFREYLAAWRENELARAGQ